MIYGNAVMSPAALKTVILEDANGNTLTGVIVDNKIEFTATDNDVREGKTYVSGNGASTGTKDIPAYHTTTGVQVVFPNKEFKIVIDDKDKWDYTELQAMIMPYNSSAEDSVAVDRVVINDKVYNVGSTMSIATISKDQVNKAISLNLTNGNRISVIRFFTYKEES